MRCLLLSTVSLLVVPALALAAPDFISHTHTTPIELKSISSSATAVTAVSVLLTEMTVILLIQKNNAKMKVIPLLLVPYLHILPVNVLIMINILLNVWKTDPELAKKPVLPKLNALLVWLWIQPALMMLTTKNVSATLVRVMIIPMRKLRLRVMWLTEAAKAVLKQNISAKKTPAPVT